MRVLFAALFAAGLLATPAQAAVTAASPSAFIIQNEINVSASPEQAWRALTQVGNWWNGDHTYSRDAHNLTLDARAGGCWCERWGHNSVEHMHVVMVMERGGIRTLRMVGALGPLQEMGARGFMTFTVTPRASGAKVTFAYRVIGDPALGLDHVAPAVDGVLMEQMARLARYTDRGSPN